MLSKLFALVGQYFILMGKVFSRPEKLPIYRRRIIYEMDALGLNSIGLTAIISVFIGAVITLQMSINLESPFIPKYIIGYATRETMILEFSSTVVALKLAGRNHVGQQADNQHDQKQNNVRVGHLDAFFLFRRFNGHSSLHSSQSSV